MAPFLLFFAGVIVSLVGSWFAYVISMHKSDLEYRFRKLEELFILVDQVIYFRLNDHVIAVSTAEVDQYIITHYASEDEAKRKLAMLVNIYFIALLPAAIEFIGAVQASRHACLNVLGARKNGESGSVENAVVYQCRAGLDGPYSNIMNRIMLASRELRNEGAVNAIMKALLPTKTRDFISNQMN